MTTMSNLQGPSNPVVAPSAPDDLPPPYSAVVGNPQYGFVAGTDIQAPPGMYPAPKAYTAPGVYPYPSITVTNAQPQAGDVPRPVPPPPPPPGHVSFVVPAQPAVCALGIEPTNATCYSCGKTGTTRVNYTTAWHTHLIAGSVCMITMVCSMCCLGLVPYCFDTFKDAEHYCPHCNAFLGRTNKCV